MPPRATGVKQAKEKTSPKELAKRQAKMKAAAIRIEKEHVAACATAIKQFNTAQQREQANLLKAAKKLLNTKAKPDEPVPIRKGKFVVSAVHKLYPDLKLNGDILRRSGGRPDTEAPSCYVVPAEAEVGARLYVNLSDWYRNSDRVFMTLPGQGDVLIGTVFSGDTETGDTDMVSFFVPEYEANDFVTGYVFIERNGQQGTPCPVRLRPNIPVIYSLSVPAGSPGDPVLITGGRFKGKVEVHFIVAQGVDKIAEIEHQSTDTQLFVCVPEVSGVTEFQGVVYVVSDSHVGNLYQFTFKPKIVLQPLNIEHLDDFDIFEGTYFDDWRKDLPRVKVSHMANIAKGYKNDDKLLSQTRLRNGWVLDQVLITVSRDEDDSNAGVAESELGTSSLRTVVHWWCDAPYNSILYYVSWMIKGPDGVDCF